MDGKVLGDLKVAELRGELEKRDLDKNGVKQVLIERLKEALISEGKDPAAYMFSSVVTVLPSAEVSLVSHLSTLPLFNVLGDPEVCECYNLLHSISVPKAETQSIEPGPENTKAEEVASEECTIATKKETGDSDPYVVHIEEPEEDLDYDLKSEFEKDADAKDRFVLFTVPNKRAYSIKQYTTVLSLSAIVQCRRSRVG
ncbi:unnamed protein product [Schistocephalus solidus]|uniref:SAP domain-containing protein n=1 Tax=Schistocephalus solidus TaxID=70667 RepID=A0A183SX63_SCHSO|nr:unnamed protein product [Schistocephalus solidus]